MGATKQSTVIASPADKVWHAIRNFHDMSWAPNVITKCAPVGDVKGDQIGAKRILNDAFHENGMVLDILSPDTTHQDTASLPLDRRHRLTFDDGRHPHHPFDCPQASGNCIKIAEATLVRR